MKKFLFTYSLIMLFGLALNAQTTTPTPSIAPAPSVDKSAEFDKKFRFGLRGTPQPTWFNSDNKNSLGAGAGFGFGFGLILEFKLSKIIHFSTGVGGDFEGGKISYRNDADFGVNVVMNGEGQYVEAKDGVLTSDYQFKNGNTQYVLKDRNIKTTYVTLPVALKMMTEEYSGIRYFANTGLEIGIKTKAIVTDNYYSGLKSVVSSTGVTTSTSNELTKSEINISKDLIPVRVGMNLGLGLEYRIAGSTSLMFSANYFHSFTNTMYKESKYLVKGHETYTSADNTVTFESLNQGYFLRAIRINIGILF